MDIPIDYNQADYIMSRRNKFTLKNKRSTYLRRINDTIEMVYHNTPVVTYHPDNTISLNSGGYHTVTTKARMNSALGNKGYVFQKNHKWYFHANGFSHSFIDGIRI